MSVEMGGRVVDGINHDRTSTKLGAASNTVAERVGEEEATSAMSLPTAVERQAREKNDGNRIRHPPAECGWSAFSSNRAHGQGVVAHHPPPIDDDVHRGGSSCRSRACGGRKPPVELGPARVESAHQMVRRERLARGERGRYGRPYRVSVGIDSTGESSALMNRAKSRRLSSMRSA